MVNLIS
jgi:tetratricopeptide (TPR) repeat protein